MPVVPDRYGFCVVCNKNMIIKKVVDNKVINTLSPDYCEVEYLLNDKSKMRVAMCEKCKSNLTIEQSEDIMKSVLAGWEEEIIKLDWTKEKKQTYMNVYSQKEIVCNSEGLAPDILDKIHKDYLQANKEKVNELIGKTIHV